MLSQAGASGGVIYFFRFLVSSVRVFISTFFSRFLSKVISDCKVYSITLCKILY